MLGISGKAYIYFICLYKEGSVPVVPVCAEPAIAKNVEEYSQRGYGCGCG
jgi:hypothetical protein